jgi:hypothetical protein
LTRDACWPSSVGFRNVLVHGYADVDDRLVVGNLARLPAAHVRPRDVGAARDVISVRFVDRAHDSEAAKLRKIEDAPARTGPE